MIQGLKRNLKKYKIISHIYRLVFNVSLVVRYYLYDKINDDKNIKIYGNIEVESVENTIDYIIKNKCSVARYGDGEFSLINGKNIGFQSLDNKLSKSLENVLKSNDKNMLICIPDVFNSLDKYTFKSKIAWKSYLSKNRINIYNLLDNDRVYYNAFISRPYMMFKNKSNSDKVFKMIKKIWNNKEVVIVEGEKTRFGIGNDLLDNARSVERILIPAEDCFSKYSEIYTEVLKYSKNKIILLAAGPVATILAYDLYKQGYQAIDVGHADIEYEWFLRKSTTKVKIDNKYTNEAVNGGNVEDISDSHYLSQIKKHISNS